jgi:serine phosphatase RsbU (regulator of sigma subunit)
MNKEKRIKYLKPLLLLPLILNALSAFAQDPDPDSLGAVLERTPEDTSRVNVLNVLAYSLHRTNPEEAIKYGLDAIVLADEIGFQKGLAEAYKIVGLGYYMQGNYTEALRNWESSLKLFELLGDEPGIANVIGNRGSIYYTTGNNPKALEDYLRALPIAEKLDDSVRIGTLLLNIGSVYSEQPSTRDSAINYYHRSLGIGESIGYFNLVSLAYINLGELYLGMENYDSSLYYFEKSLTVVSSSIDLSVPLNYIGKIYAEKGDYQTAIKYHQDALAQAITENAQLEIVRVLLGLGSTYEKQGNPRLAIENYGKAEGLAREIGLNYELSEIYKGLSEAYAKIRDYRNAYKYLSLRNEIDNANLRREAENKTNLTMFTYQLDKKQDEITLLEQQTQIEQLASRRQRAIIIATGSLGLLLLIMAAGFYNRMRYIRETNEKIKAQRDEIELQRNKIEKQRDQLQLQHDMVFAQKELITDSINYAQRIQSVLLPPLTILDGLISDYFVLFKPKDIVSGDFYWIKEVQEHLVIVSADCTGHGVPGAFMSMLGITLLNGLIGDRCYNAPSAILEQLRKKIKEMLVQEGHADEQKDGMDMAIVVLDRKNRELHYAGANNPLYIIRNRKLTGDLPRRSHSFLENGEFNLFEVKADKQPIGIHWEETSFRNHSIPLMEHDTFYLFSDGYVDQFGGKHRKKFKSLNFKKLLLSIQTDPMDRQKEILEQTFETWRGKYEQIDDVSVIGVRI